MSLQFSHSVRSPRQCVRDVLGSYNDSNDDFCRTNFSRSKHNHSRNTKEGKVRRVRPPWRKWEWEIENIPN